MTLRNLPKIDVSGIDLPRNLSSEPPSEAVARWNAGIKAADSSGDNVITIYDVIGYDPWTGGGVTSKRIGAALRAIGNKDVVVNINSPGGDFFEGVAIYNLLRAHSHRVTVNVMGLAASAASIIAMAGDEILMAKAGFMMVHNVWVVAVGNRHDMTKAAETLKPFDEATAGVYADQSGQSVETTAEWMDDEKWFNGSDAVSVGLADGLVPADQVVEADGSTAKSLAAVRRIEGALKAQGLSRSESRSLIAEMKDGKPGAAATTKPGAGGDVAAELQQLLETIST